MNSLGYVSTALKAPELIIPGRRPVGPVRLNLDHPLSKNLRIAYLGGGPAVDVGVHPKQPDITYSSGATITEDYIATGNASTVLPVYTGDMGPWINEGLEQLTVVARVKKTSTACRGGFSIHDYGLNYARTGIIIANANIFFTVENNALRNITTSLAVNVWADCAVVFDGTQATVIDRVTGYKDGVAYTDTDVWPTSLPTTHDRLYLAGYGYGTAGYGQQCQTGYGFMFDIPLSAKDIADIHDDPYQFFEYDGPVFTYSAGDVGGVVLTVQDNAHGHVSDNIALSQSHILGVQNASHGHAADSLVLQVAGSLEVAGALSGHVSDNIVLSQLHVLSLQDSSHGHVSDNVVLQAAGELAIQGAVSAHLADNVDLVQAHVIAIADSAHTHVSENITLDSSAIIVIQDSSHGHSADVVDLSQAHVLSIADAVHGHIADNVGIGVEHATLIISDALHAHYSDPCNVSESITIIETPQDRIFVVRAENRVIAITAARTITIQ